MDYMRIYSELISNALSRTVQTTYTEIHHIVPRSMGGDDNPINLVRLTLREHRMAHILLAVSGHANQWASVAAILQDRINKNKPYRYNNVELKVTKFIRRNCAKFMASQKKLGRCKPYHKSQ